MKIYFINPPFKWEYGKFSRESRSPAVAKSGVLYYPLWLIYAAAYAEKKGFDVSFLDAPAKSLNFEQSLNVVEKELVHANRSNDEATTRTERTSKDVFKSNECLFVLDTSTPSIENDGAFAAALKEKFPESFVYMVGTHPTSTVDETLNNYEAVDGIARKEYDFTITKLAEIIQDFYNKKISNGIYGDEDLSEKTLAFEESENVDVLKSELSKKLSMLKGISYRDIINGKIMHNDDAEYISELDEIPLASDFIKRHLDYKDYFFAAAEYPEIQIFTGRGCPCRCNFCVYPQTMHGHKYRLRSPQNVVDEFKYIAENFPDVKEIVIEDDTFTIDKKRVTDICNLLIETGMNKRFKWLCNARVNTLDLDTMKLMKRAGCRLLIPGIESGTQEILDNIKKGTTLEQVREYIKNTKKAGLLVHACYMVGNQGETKETMQKTLELALELNTDTAQFFPLIPYPGTEAYVWAKSKGYIKAGYSEYCREDGTHNSVLNLPDLSGEEMVRFCNDARKKYYLRLRYILHRLWTGLKDPNDLKRSLKAFGKFKNYLFK